MAYMAVVVSSDAADVELDLALFKGDKRGFLAGFGVVDLDTHGLFHRVDMRGRESRGQERGSRTRSVSACFCRIPDSCRCLSAFS